MLVKLTMSRHLPWMERSFRSLDLSWLNQDQAKVTLLRLTDLRQKTRELIDKTNAYEHIIPVGFLLTSSLPRLRRIDDLLDEHIETLAYSLDSGIKEMLGAPLEEVRNRLVS